MLWHAPETVLGMSEEFASFISGWCGCHYCHDAVSKNLEKCDCGEQRDPYIDVEFPAEIFDSIFIPLHQKESNRQLSAIKSNNRKNRIADNGGSFTKEEIAIILQIQERRCYYCGDLLITPEGKNRFHVDHFVPLLDGGRNDIFNLVLACPECNLKKGGQDGGTFTRSVSRKLDIEMREQLKAMRRNLRLHKKKLERTL